MAKLFFTARTPKDRDLAHEAFENGDVWFEYDARTGSFSFEEESECLDSLETILQGFLDECGVNGYFEGEV